MKNTLLAIVALIGLCGSVRAFDGPYFKKIYGKDGINVNASLGAVLDEKGSVQDGAFTSLAVIYHDADAENTLIPENLQPYLPPEAWTLLSIGYGGGLAGLGASINLAATVQGYAARGLMASGNSGLEALGKYVQPGASPLSLNVGPEWFSKIVDHSTVLPFNQWKGRPGWFVGGAYTKKF